MTRYTSNGLNLNRVNVEVSSHTSTLLEGLTLLRSKNQLLDVTLIAQGEHFQAHRLLLAACSDYFRAMFTGEMKEKEQENIELHGVSAVGLRRALAYMYTGTLSLDLATVQDVLAAAAHLQLPAVQEACAAYLQDQLDLENCVDVASLAETYILPQLRNRAYAVMCSQLREFSATVEFQRLHYNQLAWLLRCDHPVNCSEGEVAAAVARWVQHCPSRHIYACRLFFHINWSEVPQQVRRSLPPLLSPTMYNCERCVDSEDQPNPPKGLLNTRGLELALVKVGGFSMTGITNEITYRLSPSQSWYHLTTIPHVDQCNFGTAVLDNELYVVGGCFNQCLQENIHPFGFRYSPLTDKWDTLSPMRHERCRFTLTVLNEKLYAVGGEGEEMVAPTTECEVYDPSTDMWQQIPGLPECRVQHAAVAFNGSLFVMGGLELGPDTALKSCWILNADSHQWTRIHDLLVPRADHSAFVFDGTIYVCGGWNEDAGGNNRRLVSTVECYIPGTSHGWKEVTTVPTPRFHAGIAVIGSRLLIMGGFHSDATFDRATGIIECYDLLNDEWHNEPAYPRVIWEHTCVALHVPRCREDMAVMFDS